MISAGSQVRILSRPLNNESRPAACLGEIRKLEKQTMTVLSLCEEEIPEPKRQPAPNGDAGSLTSTYRVVNTTFRAESENRFGSN